MDRTESSGKHDQDAWSTDTNEKWGEKEERGRGKVKEDDVGKGPIVKTRRFGSTAGQVLGKIIDKTATIFRLKINLEMKWHQFADETACTKNRCHHAFFMQTVVPGDKYPTHRLSRSDFPNRHDLLIHFCAFLTSNPDHFSWCGLKMLTPYQQNIYTTKFLCLDQASPLSQLFFNLLDRPFPRLLE